MRRKFYAHGVRASDELKRILSLPVKTDLSPAYDDIRQLVTRPSGHGIDHTGAWYCEQCQIGRPFDHQCQSLLEVLDVGGLFAQLPVGAGKTLVCALIPTMLERSAVILTHKALADQMHRMLMAYRVHFYIRPDIRVETYERLSSQKHRDLLQRIRPGIVIADECDALAGDSARTGRFRAFFEDFPETIYCPLSGSPGKSINDFAANLNLSLGDGSPLPHTYNDLLEWSEALDVSDNPRPPGKLKLFCEPGETVQEGWGRRFLSTRGVVSTAVNDPGVPLTIHTYTPPEIPEISEAVAGIENTWERPDGEVFLYATDVARAIGQVRLGGYYRWNWKAIGRDEPDQEWLEARRNYHRDVREFLKGKKVVEQALDSPGLIKAAHLEDLLAFDSWHAWDLVRDRPVPPTEWIWISKARLDWIAELGLRAYPCIVFADVVSFAVALAKRMGVRYFGDGPKAREGIIQEKGDRTIVASIGAHYKGRNLQMYSRAVVAGGSGSVKLWEQLLGRLHRTGQKKPVRYDVLFPYEVDKAKLQAQWSWETKKQPQKLLTCEYVTEGAL